MEQNNLCVQNLSEEILLHIFSFLDPNTIIASALVSKEWYHIAVDDHLWKELIAEKKPNMAYSTQLLPPDGSAKRLYMELSRFSTKSLAYPLLQTEVFASSSDHKEQGADKPIIPLEQRTNDLFWSSKGSSDINSNECLVYKLVQPLCILNMLQILPYKANFQKGQPIYAPQAIQLSVGFTPSEMHWKSRKFSLRNINEIQTINIFPELVIGTYIKIDLYGRNTVQPADDLYYTCLEYLNLLGSPIGSLSNECIALSSCNYALRNNSFIVELENNSKVGFKFKNSLELFNYFKEELPVNAVQYLQRKTKIEAIYKYLNVEYNCIEPIKMVLTYREELHSNEVFELFKAHGNKYLKPYFNALLSDPNIVFSKQESLELIKLVLGENISKMLMIVGLWLEQGKITISEELGDFIAQYDKRLASSIYLSIPIPDKFIDTLLHLKLYAKILKYVTIYQYPIDFIHILSNLKQKSILDALEFAVVLSERPGGSPVDLAQVCQLLNVPTSRDTWDYRKLLVQELEKTRNSMQ